MKKYLEIYKKLPGKILEFYHSEKVWTMQEAFRGCQNLFDKQIYQGMVS